MRHSYMEWKRWSALFKGCLLLAVSMMPFWSDAQVSELWVARYDESGNEDARAIAIDSQGNVYVTGFSGGDYATVKYDANGNQLWVARYNGSANSQDKAEALAVDSQGNVYVTGASYGDGTNMDYATVKYDANGNQLWVARYNGASNGEDVATALTVDSQGNVYVTGVSKGAGADDIDYATVKYDTNGNQLWVARYDGFVNARDAARALAVDSQGNVYVTGFSGGDYATVKYDTNGNQLWVARYDGAENGTDQARALAVDSQGNVYVTGASYGGGTNKDYATVKYDANGNQLWVARYNGSANSQDEAEALAVDSQGNVYVTGASYGDGTNMDYATVKYDANGNQLWVARYNEPSDADDFATALAVDSQGSVYVTGFSGDPSDYATVKYDANGNQLWVARYNGASNGEDVATALTVDSQGNVYVTGFSASSETFDYATVKYVQCPSLCPADVDGNGIVDDADLLAVLFAFGNTGSNLERADVDCSGVVDDADLLRVLFDFGSGC